MSLTNLLKCFIAHFGPHFPIQIFQNRGFEYIEKTSPNDETATSMIKSYQLNYSACKELPFDILHAYLASNMRVFQESGSSKKKTLKTALPMLEWQPPRSKVTI